MHLYKLRILQVVFCTLFAPASTTAENYLDYYQLIASAEEAVIHHKFGEAINRYDTAFSSFTYNNPIDCYVAAQVAGYSGDSVHCSAFLCKGFCFGLPLVTVQKNPHTAGYVKRLNPSVIDSCLAAYQNRIDKRARAVAIALTQRDQSIVRNTNSIYDRQGRLKPMYVPVWDSLLHEVIQLIKTSGFPAQKVIGTQDGGDGLFAAGPNSVYVYYIFVHHGRAWPLLEELLPGELRNGTITPQMYAAIEDHLNGHDDYARFRYFGLRPCQNSSCKKIVSNRLDAINADRKKIGLGTYEIMESKFASTLSYSKWIKKTTATPQPVFDFQPELHFMGNK